MAAAQSPFVRRKAIYKKIGKERSSTVIAYVTGDRQNMEARVHQEQLGMFADHLDTIGATKRITLLLHTRGGDTLGAWSIVNLLRMFCDDLEIIVPMRAHSAGTLICLGANRIILTKQGTLGPIDPSLQSPLCPQIPGAPPDARAAVSVEAIRGFLSFAKEEVGIKDEHELSRILLHLADKVHPLVLGQIFRTQSQIQNLARQLLQHQVDDEKTLKKIIGFLCSESGSHDYTINRREAAALGLKIEKPTMAFYKTVKSFWDTVRHELELETPFDPRSLIGGANEKDYRCIRCLIESVSGGSHMFVTEGKLRKVQLPVQPGQPVEAIQDERHFEGWRAR